MQTAGLSKSGSRPETRQSAASSASHQTRKRLSEHLRRTSRDVPGGLSRLWNPRNGWVLSADGGPDDVLIYLCADAAVGQDHDPCTSLGIGQGETLENILVSPVPERVSRRSFQTPAQPPRNMLGDLDLRPQ